jgi:cytochrome c biogenesis protein CcmG, thiol:disulfide interchange protein DsbE
VVNARNLLLGGALLLGVIPVAAQAPAPGMKAPRITVAALDGSSVTIDAAATGRPAVIEFWATWCSVCDELLPRMRTAHAQFKDRVDFYGVNVTVNESRARVQRWVEREQPPYRTLYDEKGVAVRAFGAPTTSYVVIVDGTGVVRYTGSGGAQAIATEVAKVVTR